ncbi:DUF397 domain-containing protein [Streptomyces scopuliridis]|uniref:DUF397 domain-containing protein n=1 Tax=Streptomyces scopuliridis TaxID=452529 RepID=A0ACD4ZGK9_9ACTN|nr:DUF397 domain-containing protein [Streptomyces scopuliridis]WSB33327.1 DUF397 domain-containing protein [Streptomyces scopuliridis]WSB97595.1 DUF397 domain-containing protein [Streptomyces scopuliridis]WSC08702.1 DUF397 domain-containing protein [Streptomyces scopuliridis]
MTITADALTGADWFTSSYSNDHPGGDCVEGARLADGVMAVRDSKDPHGLAFVVGGGPWAAFLDALTEGEV